MSDGPRIPLDKAEAFVLALFQRRLGYASIEEATRDGVEVVGSIRRRRPTSATSRSSRPCRGRPTPSACKGSEAVIHMAIARLGGLVEGRPTHRGNFLQRIDELVRIEARQ